MGWAGGASLANDVWAIVRDGVRPEELKIKAREVISLFKDHDADDWDSGMQIVQDTNEPEEPDDEDDDDEEEIDDDISFLISDEE